MSYRYKDSYYADAERLWQTLPVGKRVILETLGHELALSEQDKPLHGQHVRSAREIKQEITEKLSDIVPRPKRGYFKISLQAMEQDIFTEFLKRQHQDALAMLKEEKAANHVQELETLGVARELYLLVLDHGQKKAAEHKNRLTSL